MNIKADLSARVRRCQLYSRPNTVLQGCVGNVVQEPNSSAIYIEITNDNLGSNNSGGITFWVD